jgi:RNA polymerase sigma-70 factor (ECF subfamily)
VKVALSIPLMTSPCEYGHVVAMEKPQAREPQGHQSLAMHEQDETRWSALMASAQSGNEADYRQLLAELSETIERFLNSRFGQHAFVEDCVQEALIAIHQARHTYDPGRPFRPWLFAIVRRKAIDTLRKQEARQRNTDQFVQQQDILGKFDHDIDAGEEHDKGRLLALLPDAHRNVLLLTKIAGYSIAETAQKLDISESLVKVRVHRAIGKLKKMMEAERL